MSTALAVFLVIVGLLAVAGLTLFFWVRAKARRGIAWLKVQGLAEGLKELREKQSGTPADQQPDAELAALIARVETAHGKAKTAYEKEDWNGVSEAADPVLKELLERLEEKLRKEQEAKAAAAKASDPAALPAPTDSAESRSDAAPDAEK